MNVIYQNRHWLVLEDGVESAGGLPSYDFGIERVFENVTRGSQKYYGWPVHMAEKTWVDISLFIDAFDRAIRYQAGVSGEVIDEDMLTRSYDEARRIKQERLSSG